MHYTLTCVHRSLCVQTVCATLISLSTQSQSIWLLRQTTRTNRPAVETSASADKHVLCDRVEQQWCVRVKRILNDTICIYISVSTTLKA